MMKIRLLRDARIQHYAGETIDVSPAEACFLCSVGSAIEIRESAQEEKKTAPKKAAKKKGEVAEDGTESKK